MQLGIFGADILVKGFPDHQLIRPHSAKAPGYGTCENGSTLLQDRTPSVGDAIYHPAINPTGQTFPSFFPFLFTPSFLFFNSFFLSRPVLLKFFLFLPYFSLYMLLFKDGIDRGSNNRKNPPGRKSESEPLPCGYWCLIGCPQSYFYLIFHQSILLVNLFLAKHVIIMKTPNAKLHLLNLKYLHYQQG